MPFATTRSSRPAPASRAAGPARTYRLRIVWRTLLSALGALSVAGGVAAIAFGLAQPAADAAAIGVGLGFGVLGACAVAGSRARLTLRGDEIVLEEPFSSCRLRRDAIAGRRTLPQRYGPSILELLPSQPGAKKLRLHDAYERDAAFDAWLEAIPDLDLRDHEAAEAALDEALEAAAPGAGERTLEAARRAARWLRYATFCAGAWGLLSPRPYGLAMGALAVLPVASVAAAVRWRGIIQIDEHRNDPRPSVGLSLLGPGAVLTMRTIQDLNLVRHGGAIALGAAAAAALVGVAASTDPALRGRPWLVGLLALLTTAWGYGAVVEANALLDPGRPKAFRVEVVGRHVTHGKSTTWELRLAPWGPCTDEEDVRVPREVYDRVGTGATVETILRPGALGIPWYVVRA